MWHWTKETYHRRKVEDVEEFVGWPYLEDLVKKCKHPRDEALISALFETGGRVSEILLLEKQNFVQQKLYVVVKTMPVLKRYEKISKYQDEEGKTRWVTRRKKGFRTFPIHVKEPLTPILMSWVQRREGRLFSIGRKRVYQIVTELDQDIYPHWFRAQRASQLALEYGYSVHDLVDFFNWKDLGTAVHYSRMGWKGLATKMVR